MKRNVSLVLLLLALNISCAPSLTTTLTAAPTPTILQVAVATATQVVSPTLTATRTPTPTDTATPTATRTNTPTLTPMPTATATVEPNVPALEQLNPHVIYKSPSDTHIGRPLVGIWNTDGWDKCWGQGNADVREMADDVMGKFLRFTRTGLGIGPSGEIRYQCEEQGQKTDGNIAVTMKFRIGPKNMGGNTGNTNILTTFSDAVYNPPNESIYILLANVNFDRNRNFLVQVFDPDDPKGDTFTVYTSAIKLDSNRWYGLELRAFRGTKLINVLLDGKPVVFDVKGRKTIWVPSYSNAKDISLKDFHGGYYKYDKVTTFHYDADDYIDNTAIETFTFDYPFPQGD